MKNILFIFLMQLILPINLVCQKNKVTYYNKELSLVKNKKKAEYYRIVKKENDSLSNKIYIVEYFTIDSILLSSGSYSDKHLQTAIGKFKLYYENGNLSAECNYVDNKKQGQYKKWYINGNRKSISNYLNDTLNGKFISWYETDTVSQMLTYKDGNFEGYMYTFYTNGATKRVDVYKQGQLIEGVCYTSEGKDTSYFPYIINPSFTGGIEAFLKNAKKEIVYPASARVNDQQGNVVVYAIVDITGKIVNPRILRTDYSIFNNEALRVVENSSGWIPGRLDGIISDMPITVTIDFHIKQ